MSVANVRKLQPGDEVTWSDPDAGTCSRTGRISTIEVRSDGFVRLTWADGADLECWARELS